MNILQLFFFPEPDPGLALHDAHQYRLEDDIRTSRLARWIAAMILAASSIALSITLVVDPANKATLLIIAGFGLSALAALFVFRTRANRLARIIMAVSAWALTSAAIFFGGGVVVPFVVVFFMVILEAALLLGRRALILFTFLSILSVCLGFIASLIGLIPTIVAPPMVWLIFICLDLMVVAFFLFLAIGTIETSLEAERETRRKVTLVNQDLESIRRSLEERVNERTLDLARRTRYLQTTADVSRAVLSILEPARLQQTVVDLICERFELYYVGLFLVDSTGATAVLKAGSGEAARAMIARNHRIQIGQGMVGWCIANSRARIAQTAQDDPIRLTNPELPETRSEAALPLRSRGQVIGALSVQSTQPNAFDGEVVNVLQIMADQVAIAVDNSRLFTEREESLESVRSAFNTLTRQAWQQLVNEQSMSSYRYQAGDVIESPTVAGDHNQDRISSGAGQVLVSGNLAVLPIKARDQVIGEISIRKPDAGPAFWSPDEIDMLETLAEQIGAALESARLYQETRQWAAREQIASEVTARMRESLNIQSVLQTAAAEIYRALGLRDVSIQLHPDSNPLPAAEAAAQPAVPA
jgi:GAF domain-containing protein